MNENITEWHLDECGLQVSDAVRLALECIERLGEEASNERLSLIGQLRRVIELGVEALKREEETVSFEQAAWASVAARVGRRATTCRDLRHFVRRMLRVPGVAERPIRAMSTKECRKLLQQAFGNSVHSYRKGRAVLHSIFAYAYRQEWCAENPVSRIEVPEVEESPVLPLKPEDVEKLFRSVRQPRHRPMRFSLYLMLYCGVRPAEIARIVPSRDILWGQKMLVIRSTSSKTGGGRVIPLRNIGQLKREDCEIPTNWLHRWQSLRRDAGFTHWQADCLRHTFASYHAHYFKDLPQLQLEMGHRDCHLLRTRYILPVDESEARKFWKLNVL